MQKMKLNSKFLLHRAVVIFALFLLVSFPLSAQKHPVNDGHNHSESNGSKDNHEDHESKEDHGHDENEGEHEGHGNKDEDDHSGHDDEGFVKMSWKRAKAIGVTFSKVSEGKIKDEALLHGETALKADSIIHVTPRFPGTIIKIGKDLGESVKKGDLLAIVQSNESLTPYNIKADVDGIIIEKDAARGEFVSNNSKIFVIANLSTVWANAAVYPRDFGRIKVGSEAIVFSKDTGLSYKGKVDYIRPTLSEPTRTALARVIIPNPDKKWLPGLFVTVKVTLDSYTIPLGVKDEAILLIENKPSVFVKTKNKNGIEGFKVREIISGKSDGNTTEILSGLKGSEVVATGRTFILKADLEKGAAEHSH